MTIGASLPLVLTPEHEELRASVRSFFAGAASESEVRRLMATVDGYDPAVWARLSGELGATSMAIPESLGGAGYGFVEVGVVLEEAGRTLLAAPYFSTVVLATTLLLECSDPEAQGEFLPPIANGKLRATVVVPDAHRSIGAEFCDGCWRLSGSAALVLDGHTAQLLLIAADTSDGTAVFAVDTRSTQVDSILDSTMDLTRKLATLEFDATPARQIEPPATAAALLEKVRVVAAVGLAAEQVGGAQRVLDMAVDYAKARHQFGRPIGSFQAIKHRLADMLVQVESARSAAYAALWAVALDSPDLAVIAALAKSFCSDAFLFCAGESIQIHGGIGFTWEHPAHLYFKRAKSSQLMFGDPGTQRQRIATHLGI
jgi:alkylation response protein AidB-like acyl-CoA dehydrogenase